MDLATFQAKLVAQLPSNIPLYLVEEVDLKTPSATQCLTKAEYLLTVTANAEVSLDWWQRWIEAVKTSDKIEIENTTKSGKKQVINLRDRLFELELQESGERPEHSQILRYVGSCYNDGNLLKPDHVIYMLQKVASVDFQLLGSHRRKLILASEV